MDLNPTNTTQATMSNGMQTAHPTKSVRKRDGSTMETFDPSKIRCAVAGAWKEVQGTVEERALNKVMGTVLASLADEVLDVEVVQDAVETALMRHGHFAVAKAYIVYRHQRSEARQARVGLSPDPKAISDYIHAGKYARYLPEAGRREVYEETVARVEAMHITRHPSMEEDIRWAFDLVRQKRVLPSMRSMQFGGNAILTNHSRIYNCSFTLVDRMKAFSEALFLLLSGCGVGYSVQFDHVENLPPIPYIDAKKIRHHVVGDSIEGWADALDALTQSFLDGVYLEISYHLIRDAGTPLKTSGGRAPGHVKLKESLERIRQVLSGAQGRQLRPVECHRIMCHAADAVLSGGIRRSAMICLFSFDDSEMMNIKTGNWWATEPYLANANNSVVLKREDVRKKQFKRIFKMTREWGEPGFYFTSDYDYGTNPCFHPDTRLWTSEGYVRVGDLYKAGGPLQVIADRRPGKGDSINLHEGGVRALPATSVFLAQRNAEVFRLTTEHGHTVDVTSAHEFPTVEGRKKLQDLKVGDTLFLPSGEGSFGSKGSFSEGLVLGDSDNLHVPDVVWSGSKDFVAGYLRGVFQRNGDEGCPVRLRAELGEAFLSGIQVLLSMFGIVSGLDDVLLMLDPTNAALFRDKIGIGGEKRFSLEKYLSERREECLRPEQYTTRVKNIKPIGTSDVYCLTQETTNVVTANGIVTGQCAEIGLDSRLVINERLQEKLAAKGVKTEIGQKYTGWAFCNLCEINAAKFTSFEDFLVAAKAATLIGTLQATYTTMPYLGWVSEAIAERDSLLGIGMTGILDAPHISCKPEYQREVAQKVKEWNAEYAARLGINPAARSTTVKPSGTTSLELGCVASGHHAHHARRYIRRVTADELETIFQAFRAINPHMCVRKPDGKWVIEFPVEAPPGATIKEDLSAIEFLEMVKSTQQNWVIPGTAENNASPGLTHNVSNTVTVKPDEWDKVADYLWENRHFFTGVSLLPSTGDKDYAFAPNESVSTPADEARYNAILAGYKPVDYTAIVEYEDVTNLTGEAACAGGACAVT